jgi:hypothetical protein
MKSYWNTLRFAMYGACLGLFYAAFFEIEIRTRIELWTQSPHIIGQAVGGLIGGAIAGAILGSVISGVRNLFVRFFR